MRKFFLTLDFEEWYHLEYLKEKVSQAKPMFVDKLKPFFEILKEKNIKITVFTLAELAKEFPGIIKNIAEDGHEIACHGYDHDLLYTKSNQDFERQIIDAKKLLEDISGKSVIGYRASCFSMTREKLDILQNNGFKYDSSFIRFSQHTLYKQFDISDFTSLEDLVFEKNGFYEFEIPTYRFSKYNIPISGGGYFRFFPYWFYNYLFVKYIKRTENFVFYIHPFEIAFQEFTLKGFSKKDYLRFSLGRKSTLKNLENFIKMNIERHHFNFLTFRDYLNQ